MANNIVYQGLTFSQTPSGEWLVATNFGEAVGPTPAQAVLNASNSIAYKNPNSESIQQYADGIRGIALDPATNGGVTRAMRALDRPVPPTSDTAANKIANDPPVANPPVALQETAATPTPPDENDTLSPSEGKNLSVSTAGAGAAINNYDIGPSFSTKSEATSGETTKATTANNERKKPIPNPLLAYPSYTYGLSLALLTVEEYNDIVADVKNYKSNRVIIASAGRYNNDEGASMFKRAPFFAEDFYFENLNMTTVIGFNDRSRSTNAIDLKFSIIEPYGVTLLNRIIDLSTEIKSPNYIAQPYLLQIDFFGTNDAGEIVGIIPNLTKRIPIRLLKLDIKASPKGAEYEIEACPYNHSAYDLSTVSTPALIEVTAGTLESFLKSNTEEIMAAQLKANRELKASTILRAAPTAGANGQGIATIAGRTGNLIGPDGQLTYAPSLLVSKETTDIILGKDAVYKVKSYPGALNAYYADLAAKDNTEIADKYKFNIHPDIVKDGGGQFNLTVETLSTAHTAMASEQNGMSIRGTPGNLDHSVRVLSINTGTSIDQVIAFAMRHTNYLQGQVKPVSSFNGDNVAYKKYLAEQANKPLKWYKVVPTIKLGKYNDSNETWQREITYHILPYTVYNTKTREGPQGTWTEPCKIHNYWYTGKNNDVLDFNIEFNALYYNAVTAYRENLSRTQNLQIAETKNATLDAAAQEANALMPMVEKRIVQNSQQQSTGGAVTVEAIALADIEASLYTSTGGDMLQAKIKIIGDPHYIKQDDVFYPPEMTILTEQVDGTGIEPRLIANGSLRMDQGELYIQITVKSPSDIDESTGMMKFDSKHSVSLFSGMYRVLKVESTFSGGKFEQTLDTVRLPRQTSLEPSTAGKEEKGNRAIVATAPRSIDVDAQANIGPDFSVKKADADKAPGSAPVQDTAAPLQTSEEKALAKVDATAPETAITTQTEPVAVQPLPTSNTKTVDSALQARAAQGISDNLDIISNTTSVQVALRATQSNDRIINGAISDYEAAGLPIPAGLLQQQRNNNAMTALERKANNGQTTF
jgi:hypothetical protein